MADTGVRTPSYFEDIYVKLHAVNSIELSGNNIQGHNYVERKFVENEFT